MKKILLLAFALLTVFGVAQENTFLKGLVKDDIGQPVIGANVIVKGSTSGTITNLDGGFAFETAQKGKQTIIVSFIGYKTVEMEQVISGAEVNLGVITLASDAVGLAEVKVVANIAVDRQTPVAISNIKPQQIAQKLGTQEYPEILKSTPGVYVTKRGGGFGDADVRIRGFGSNNVAVLINGMPVNDMENDKVYWSNWAGLSEYSRTMQVQRGLGASKIAVPSVGGTINVITRTTDAKQGGSVFYSHGTAGYHKYGATVSSGLTDENWAATLSFSSVQGDGYVEGTPFKGYSYFMSVSKKLNKKHQLALTVFGAPQEHARRYEHQKIDVLLERTDGHRYNEDWGTLNGEFYSNSTNFYHKPVAILNHYWNKNSRTFISNTLYASYGMGGGGYATTGEVTLETNALGQKDWDKAYDENVARNSTGQGAGIYFQNSFNNHLWTGLLSTVKHKIGEFNLIGGIDYRYYYGQHWQQADDLFGADFVKDRRNRDAVNFYNNEVKQGGTIYYDNDGEVMWEGLFAQAEYVTPDFTAFASLAGSARMYRRYDFGQYFTDEFKTELDNDPELVDLWENKLSEYLGAHDYTNIFESDAYQVSQVTEWQTFFGYSAKAGANYNINEYHNVFLNGGYMQRQPIFSAVFQNYKNLINPDAVNEKVMSAEMGYGFRSQYASANLNAYYTLWKDKNETGNVEDPDDANERLIYNITGVNARHMGLELDFVIKPINKMEISGMMSLGDWIWANNVDTVEVYKDQTLVTTIDAMYLKNIHVADAAQTTAAVGVNYELLEGLTLGIDANYYDRLFADFELNSRAKPEAEGVDVSKVPAFFLMDMNFYYSFPMGKFNASLFGNMHNIFNTIYIADALEGNPNTYYFGYGRTWSVGLKLRF